MGYLSDQIQNDERERRILEYIKAFAPPEILKDWIYTTCYVSELEHQRFGELWKQHNFFKRMEEKKTLEQRLAAVQFELKAPKDKKAESNSGKVAFKFRNAEQILSAVKPLLQDNGLLLVLTESYQLIDGHIVVRISAEVSPTEGGEHYQAWGSAIVDLGARGMAPGQAWGSASSYAKKYALQNLFLIDDSDDDPDNRDNSDSKPALSKERFEAAFSKIKDGSYDAEKLKGQFYLSPDQLKQLASLNN